MINRDSGMFGVGLVIFGAIKIGSLLLIVWLIYSVISDPSCIGVFAGKIVQGFKSVR